MASPCLLELQGITKSFSGVKVLDGVTFDLQAGEIHGLCGENGAGKSTLMKILCGYHPHGTFEGVIRLNGRPVRFDGICEARKAGISIIHQELHLVDEMTVGENICLGTEPLSPHLRFTGKIDWRRLYARSRDLIAARGLKLDFSIPVRELGVGQRQMVEIAKALSARASILILDEPTSALTSEEAAALARILGDLKKHGVSCIYISHNLGEVLDVADRITVLRDGRNAGTDAKEALSPGEIVYRMVGRRMEDQFPPRSRSPVGAKDLFSVENLSCPGGPGKRSLEGISFTVDGGEVLGVAGLMGSGRTELAMALFGQYGKRCTGRLKMAGRRINVSNAREALGCGICLVPEDRGAQGLAQEHSLLRNLSMTRPAATSKWGWVNRFEEERSAAEMVSRLGIKTPSLVTRTGDLSGGNQQKAVIAKYLIRNPRLLILDEPTRGIDVGAKQEIYRIIDKLAEDGTAIVLISSDLRELVALSDRVLVLRRGRVSALLDRGEADPGTIMYWATHVPDREGRPA